MEKDKIIKFECLSGPLKLAAVMGWVEFVLITSSIIGYIFAII